ncbi:MAG: efflux RND transporter permease subunit, partial [Hyphomicrobiaceae bacterium]
MSGLIRASLQLRTLVLGAAVALMAMGVLRLRDMPVDVLPEFGLPVVEVQTEALGLSAGEVENLITTNLEELLSGVSWLRSVRSESVMGLSSVRLTFQPGTDVMRARQLVQERLALAYTLPNVSKAPLMLSPVSAVGRVMMIGMSSRTVSPIRMSVLAQWMVKPKLLGVPGVANVAIWGERKRQLHVQIDPRQLHVKGVPQGQVVTTAGDSLWVSFLGFLKSSVPGAGGWIDTPNQRVELRHTLPISEPRDLERVSVDGNPGVRLGDVAGVVEQHPQMIGDALIDDGSGLLLVVEKFPWANTLDVTRGVEKALNTLRTGLQGIEVDHQLFRPATFVETALANLTTALLLGAGLFFVALASLMTRWRLALIVMVTMASALGAAKLVLHLYGVTVNMMVLAGFVTALAVLIDDALTDIDTIVRRWQKRPPEQSAAASVVEAVVERRGALLYATLILVLAVVPMLFLGGLTSAFSTPLAMSYVLALGVGLLAGLTVTPVLAVLLLNDRVVARGGFSALMRGLEWTYGVLLRQVVKVPQAATWGAAMVALAWIALWPQMSGQMLPAFKERTLQIQWVTRAGTSHPEMYRITQQVLRELRTVPGVLNVNAHVGRAIAGDQVVGVNAGQLWANIEPTADYDKTVAAVQEVLSGYPGVEHRLGTYLQGRIGEALTGTDKPVAVRVFGADRDVLRRVGEDVQRTLARIGGLVDVQVQGYTEEPLVQVKVDLARAGALGLKPGDVRRAASTVFSGLEVGKIYELQKAYDVVVWSAPDVRRSVHSIKDLLLETAGGNYVRLSDVADVSIKASPASIRHAAISNYVDVTADVRGRDLGSAMRDVERRLDSVKLPFEYHTEILGEYSERHAGRIRLMVVLAVVGLGILLLLQAAFDSWRLALSTMLLLPAALVGG